MPLTSDSNLQISIQNVQYQFFTPDGPSGLVITLPFPEEATDTTYWDSLAYTIADALNGVESWGGLQDFIVKNFGGSDVDNALGGNGFSDPNLPYPE
jgi:hypothetical protein